MITSKAPELSQFMHHLIVVLLGHNHSIPLLTHAYPNCIGLLQKLIVGRLVMFVVKLKGLYDVN